MEKKKQSDFTDLMHTQIVAISKAGAYDAIQPHYAEMQKQNKEFREALLNVTKAITDTSVDDMIKNAIPTLEKISKICFDTLKANRPI